MKQPGVAYIVLCHSDPTHLSRMMHTLDENASFFVHVDAKTDIAPFEKQTYPANTYFVKKRTAVSWSAYSNINAQLSMIELALATNRNVSHIVHLSGQDYPIKPVKVIHDYLAAHANKQFIRFINIMESSDHYRDLLMKYHIQEQLFAQPKLRRVDAGLRRLAEILLTPFRKPVPNFIPCFGSALWAMTPDCAEYAVQHIRGDAKLQKYYRYVHAPEEQVFHTVVANSTFLEQTEGFRPFEGRGLYRLANLHHIHPSLTKYYTLEDYDEVASSDKFFVRKVNTQQSSPLLDRIDAELLCEKD